MEISVTQKHLLIRFLHHFLSLPPLSSYFLTAKSSKNSRLPIYSTLFYFQLFSCLLRRFLLKEVIWLIGATRKIEDRKFAKRRFERLSLANSLFFHSQTHVIYSTINSFYLKESCTSFDAPLLAPSGNWICAVAVFPVFTCLT